MKNLIVIYWKYDLNMTLLQLLSLFVFFCTHFEQRIILRCISKSIGSTFWNVMSWFQLECRSPFNSMREILLLKKKSPNREYANVDSDLYLVMIGLINLTYSSLIFNWSASSTWFFHPFWTLLWNSDRTYSD